MTEWLNFRNKSMNFWINFWFSNHLEWLIFFSFFSSTVAERYKIRYKSMNLWINTFITNRWRWYLFSSFFCSRRPLIVYSIIRIRNWFFISIGFINSDDIFIHKMPDIVVYLFITNVFILVVLLRKSTWMSKFSISLIRYWWFDFFIYRINIFVYKMISIVIYFFITNVLFLWILLSKWAWMSKFTIIFIWYRWFDLFIYIYYIFIHKMKNIIIYLFITNVFLLWVLLSKWVCFKSFFIFFKFSILLILNSFRFIKNRSWISLIAMWISLQIKHIIWKSRNPWIVSFLS